MRLVSRASSTSYLYQKTPGASVTQRKRIICRVVEQNTGLHPRVSQEKRRRAQHRQSVLSESKHSIATPDQQGASKRGSLNRRFPNLRRPSGVEIDARVASAGTKLDHLVHREKSCGHAKYQSVPSESTQTIASRGRASRRGSVKHPSHKRGGRSAKRGDKRE